VDRLVRPRAPLPEASVLPLTLPVIIFGVAAASAASRGAAPFLTPFLMLCAMSLFAIAATPFAAAAALRHVRE
jgi:heme exporter protein B